LEFENYPYAACDITVTHDDSAVSKLGRNDINVKINPKPNPNRSSNLMQSLT